MKNGRSVRTVPKVSAAASTGRLFDYRRKQPWPPLVVKGPEWERLYAEALANIVGEVPVLRSVDEAIVWANDLIARIDAAK